MSDNTQGDGEYVRLSEEEEAQWSREVVEDARAAADYVLDWFQNTVNSEHHLEVIRAVAENMESRRGREYRGDVGQLISGFMKLFSERALREDPPHHYDWRYPGYNIIAFADELRLELDRRIDGCVYILKCEHFHAYKIGKAKNPLRRSQTLDIQLPYPTEVVHVIASEDYSRLEREMHNTFANVRLKGEWFRLSERDVDLLRHFKVIRYPSVYDDFAEEWDMWKHCVPLGEEMGRDKDSP